MQQSLAHRLMHADEHSRKQQELWFQNRQLTNTKHTLAHISPVPVGCTAMVTACKQLINSVMQPPSLVASGASNYTFICLSLVLKPTWEKKQKNRRQNVSLQFRTGKKKTELQANRSSDVAQHGFIVGNKNASGHREGINPEQDVRL